MKRLSQEAKSRQAVVKCAEKKGKSYAAAKYGVSLSSVKRWAKRCDGSWQSLLEHSHRPRNHPKRHTEAEETIIKAAFEAVFFRYGWDGVFDELVKKHGYTRSFGGMYKAAKRLGLGGKDKAKKRSLSENRSYPELEMPGEKVQFDQRSAARNRRFAPPDFFPVHCKGSTVFQPSGRRSARRKAPVSVDSDRRMQSDPFHIRLRGTHAGKLR
jgi:transposase